MSTCVYHNSCRHCSLIIKQLWLVGKVRTTQHTHAPGPVSLSGGWRLERRGVVLVLQVGGMIILSCYHDAGTWWHTEIYNGCVYVCASVFVSVSV
jgi:hypothetical protein